MTKNIFLIALCGIVLSCTIHEFGYLFMSIPTFIILSYNLVELILKITSKAKEPNRELSKNFQGIIFIGIISIFFAKSSFEDTIGGYNLFWKLVFLSLFFTILVAVILSRYFNLNTEFRFYNVLAICICSFLFIPNVGIIINKHISNETGRKQNIIINYKTITKKTKGGYNYFLFIKTPYDSNERLDVEKELYEGIKDDNEIVLTLRKGILGYDYITKFDLK
ncbi:hypothetical protein EV143_10449 [Flavobacterium chryseum]|uniref:hypothetical protein n=1 Tax=Flavobacterium sp. P3160 TaxID=2512113 RepID=UPI001061C705|nr:hypothetical protein [Flavobacterium sp. P3160]TDO77288.1 hypothetical protein EV143_10449 [Flavobacterium sp. P3160]